MNEKELIGKIHSSMYHQFQVRGYAAPVDVLIDTGILPKQKSVKAEARKSSGAMPPTSSIWRVCRS